MWKGNLSGTPWHVGFLKMDESDERRHKSRCIYHTKENKCDRNDAKCLGSSHCKYYNENNIKRELKNSTDDSDVAHNQSILLCNNYDKSHIELFMNGLNYEDLPELHKVAFTKKIFDTFEFSGESYSVLNKHINRTYENSYKIIKGKKTKKFLINKIGVSNEPTIKNGYKVTLYSNTYKDIIEFSVGENYDVLLEKTCIGKSINEKFSCNGEEFTVRYFESN